MKSATPPSRGRLSQFFAAIVIPISLAGFGSLSQARAVAVDKELVLLVDVSQSGLNAKDFGSLLESYSSAFSSTQVLDAIQLGKYGSIAVSLRMYGDSSVQQVGIPWMSIASAADAAKFGDLASKISKPNAAGFPAVGSAIIAATASFGTETGGKSNGFESSLQIIDVIASVEPKSSNVGNDKESRKFSLKSGVDVVNSISLGKKADDIAAYFSANVIGSTTPGMPATSKTSNSIDANLTQVLTNSLAGNITTVPEPSSALALIVGGSMLLMRRRRA
jgi:hypothetical protein